jgi:endonuclease/exonuclease/phosphatase family metal-dependent hydrolase
MPQISLFLTLALATAVFATDEPQTLRIMSFNLRYGTANDGDNHWNKRKDLLIDTINAFKPDLLGTQETLGFQRDYLRDKLDGYEAFGVARDDGKEKGEMTAVFFRKDRFEKTDGGHFWLSETPEVVASKSWDTSLTRMCSWVKLRDLKQKDAPPVYFFNTHLDHIGRKARAESAKLIRSRIAALGADANVILTGDFNAGEASDPYKAMFDDVDGKPAPMFDTFRAAFPKPGEDEGTFTGFNAKAGKDRIDWIGASRAWAVVEAGIDRTQKEGRWPSDHFAVTAVVKRK